MLNVSFAPNGEMLAVAGRGVLLWDIRNNTEVQEIELGPPVRHVSWSADGRRVAGSDVSSTTNLWDVETGQSLATFPGGVSTFSPDGRCLAVGSGEAKFTGGNEIPGRVTLYMAPTLEEIDRARKLNQKTP